MNRLPIIGVMGSSQDDYAELSVPLGELIARMGCHLLTGGRSGTMEAVSRAFCSIDGRPGRSIGIMPDGAIANPFVEIPIYTQLSPENDTASEGWRWSRNHVNVRTSTAVVALPGGPGTASELELAATGTHTRPCIAFLGGKHTIGSLRFAESRGALTLPDGTPIKVASDIAEIEAFFRPIVGH